MGIHLINNKDEIPDNIKTFYSGSKYLVRCSCGNRAEVEYIGGLREKRDLAAEEVWIEQTQKVIRKSRKRKK